MLNRYQKIIGFEQPYMMYISTLFEVLGCPVKIFILQDDGIFEYKIFRFELGENDVNATALTLEVIRYLFKRDIYLANGKHVFCISEGELAERVVFLEIEKALKAIGLGKATLFYKHNFPFQSNYFLNTMKEGFEINGLESKLKKVGMCLGDSRDGIIKLIFDNLAELIKVALLEEPFQWQKLAFLMGGDKGLGENSPIFKDFFDSPIFDVRLVQLIFNFIPFSNKVYSSEEEKSEEEKLEKKSEVGDSKLFDRTLNVFLPEEAPESKQSLVAGDSLLLSQSIVGIKALNEEKYNKFFAVLHERIQEINKEFKSMDDEVWKDQLEADQCSVYRKHSEEEKSKFARMAADVQARKNQHSIRRAGYQPELEYLNKIISEKHFIKLGSTLTECIEAAKQVVLKKHKISNIQLNDVLRSLLEKDIPDFDGVRRADDLPVAIKVMEDAGLESKSERKVDMVERKDTVDSSSLTHAHDFSVAAEVKESVGAESEKETDTSDSNDVRHVDDFSEAIKLIENMGISGKKIDDFKNAIKKLRGHMGSKEAHGSVQVAAATKKYVNNVINEYLGIQSDPSNRHKIDQNFKEFNKKFHNGVRIFETENDPITKALVGAVIVAAAAFLLTFIPGAILLATHSYVTTGVGALLGCGAGLYSAKRKVVEVLVSDERSAELIDAGRSLVAV